MFWHKLARALGGRTVAEWQAAMTTTEFRNWQAYDLLDPIGEDRADARHALLLYYVLRAMGGRPRIEQLMPDFGKPFRQPDPAELEDRLMRWARMHNRRIEREAKKSQSLPNS